jgi:hypothetical protein
MGATLTAQLTQIGHQVAIANSRGPQTLTGVAGQTGATPVPVTDVTSSADIVIVTIPEKNIPELPPGLLSGLPGGTVVIDTGNYAPKLRDGHIGAIEAGLPESQWVQTQLRHPAVKAFNTIRPVRLAKLGKPAGRTVIPVAGDDPAAKSAVLELADQLGFDGLDAGPLAGSWRQAARHPHLHHRPAPRRRPARPGGRDPGADRHLAQHKTHRTESRAQPCTQAAAPACASS